MSQATRRLRLAYLTTEYPKVSHTFIRREILELERLGHTVHRLAIRASDAAIVDPIDQQEQTRTLHCLSQPRSALFASVAREQTRNPVGFLRAMRAAGAMSARSDRGAVRHLGYLTEACFLLGVLRKHDIEHVHVHFGTNAAAVARLMRLMGGPPYSVTIHGPDEFDAPIPFSIDWKVRDAAFTVAISDFCAAQLRRWVAPEYWANIHVVRCTVGESFFTSEPTPAPSGSRLVCVGRLTAQKGQLLLLDAVAALIRDGLDLELVFAGDGEMRSVIERRVAELGIGGRVRITGFIAEQEVKRELLGARALVLSSFAEGLPVVLMEAMALGRPVVATMIAGIPELITDGEHGFLVHAGSVPSLTAGLRKVLCASEESLTKMGEAARARVRERHRIETEVSKLESLLLKARSSAAVSPGSA